MVVDIYDFDSKLIGTVSSVEPFTKLVTEGRAPLPDDYQIWKDQKRWKRASTKDIPEYLAFLYQALNNGYYNATEARIEEDGENVIEKQKEEDGIPNIDYTDQAFWIQQTRK